MESVPFARKYFVSITGFIACLFLMLQSAFAQMHPVAAESSIRFSLKNFGFRTGGKLAAPDGDIIFNPDDLSSSSFRVTIKSESINTDNNSRDEHLKEADYFDVKNYPLIRFVSENIRAGDKKGVYEAIGTLTIKNKSKKINLPFTAEKNGNGWQFTGGFKMNRRDYDVGGSSTISNELTVDIKVLAR
jgi:polyisoprenoid-binding protein YceI